MNRTFQCCSTLFDVVFLLCFVRSITLDLRECSRPLGMESGRILSSQLSASSSHDDESTGPQNSRIRTEHGSGAWCPRNQISADVKEWLQIDFGGETVISAIETQGRYDAGRGQEYPPSYLIEYWRESLDRWALYRNFEKQEVIPANTDTQTAVIRVLDGGIIVNKLRIIPVSEATRTVCMRVEVYGCAFKDSLVSYSLPDGSVADGLDMRDSSYDGRLSVSGNLQGGLGRLYDGVIGEDNFEKHPEKWVGWRRDVQGPAINIDLNFAEQRNFSAIYLHTSNFLKHQARVFEQAIISFSLRGDGVFSPRTVNFEYPSDEKFESARWVRIPIPDRLATKVRIELFMADNSEWLLLSEIKFESGNIPFNFAYDDTVEVLESRHGTNSLTYFSVDDVLEDSGKWISLAVVAALLFLLSVILLMFYAVCCCRRPIGVKSSSPIIFGNSSKDVKLLIDGSTIKRVSPSTYRMTADNMENSLLEKMPIYSDSGSEYADPDTENTTSETKSALVKSVPSQNPPLPHSVHYATSDLTKLIHFSTGSSPTCTMRSPLSSYSRYMSYRNYGQHDANPLIEIDPNAVKFLEKIGQGEFGEVHLGQIENRLVAIKTLHPGSSPQKEDDFKNEMRVMGKLRHQNVVEVIGVCTRGEPLCGIVEYMANGDLCQFLSRNPTIDDGMLLPICTQVAAGMSYLESQNFVHRDLAARNCLVASDGTVKISDFGMARGLYNEDYYKVEGAFVLPIRWMAWECLLLGKFSSKSDVWSFGVTMWEILSRCRLRPFSALTDEQVLENIQHIYHQGQLKVYLERPDACPSVVYNQILMLCWSRNEQLRPTFQELHRHLQNMLCSQFDRSPGGTQKHA